MPYRVFCYNLIIQCVRSMSSVRIQFFIIITVLLLQVQHYVMTVQAQDAGKPMLSSTVTVYINVIDENDNAPVFETNSYNVDIYENATVNMVVATVMATDRDSGKHINRHWRLRTHNILYDTLYTSCGLAEEYVFYKYQILLVNIIFFY